MTCVPHRSLPMTPMWSTPSGIWCGASSQGAELHKPYIVRILNDALDTAYAQHAVDSTYSMHSLRDGMCIAIGVTCNLEVPTLHLFDQAHLCPSRCPDAPCRYPWWPGQIMDITQATLAFDACMAHGQHPGPPVLLPDIPVSSCIPDTELLSRLSVQFITAACTAA